MIPAQAGLDTENADKLHPTEKAEIHREYNKNTFFSVFLCEMPCETLCHKTGLSSYFLTSTKGLKTLGSLFANT